MTTSIDEATAALAVSGTPTIADAEADVPDLPGLYAIHGDAAIWRELGLGDPPDDRPLYVGKSESSLAARDIRTHFGDGRTGSSTVRRSFAALLRERLALSALPRNPQKPERFANYALSPADDAKLTRWMREHLRLAVWPRAGSAPLEQIEREVLRRWLPPLNLKDCATRWQPTVKAARAVMAAEAKAWADEHR